MYKRSYFISFLLSFLFSLNIYATDASGKITITLSNIPLSEAIAKIEAASQYTFFYDVNKTNLEQRVSLRAQELEVEDAISRLLKNTGLTFNITNRQIVLIPRQQTNPALTQKTVTGTVVDDMGDPVIGANVVEKGTLNGVITNIDGEFSLTVSENAILQISYIGYIAKEVGVKNQSILKIQLNEDSQALNEVVVIGYGVVKRKDFTGSVSSIRMEDSPIAMTSNLTALEAIKGNVPGLNIGATNRAGVDPSMQMRGQKSISDSNDPLIVVDGVIYMGSISDINPNDISSFDILKDATSAAAYGSRSANGVIIITTKKR
ncbi:MAG: TonB-dependent receptor plug domain-containing protein [Tannerellaceae bacterium]|nr:TonB-dependent receptor plug domain-containing protein [Tannerellaceae bacterium]